MKIKDRAQRPSRKCRGLSLLPIMLVWVLTRPCLAFDRLPAGDAEVPADMEQAVLAGQWEQIAQTVPVRETLTAPAVVRMIVGHASLASNRNNDALRLFASTVNDADRQAWDRWTESFVARAPTSAEAWYLRGDAQARRRNWQEATQCFDEALRLDPQCYLAWNARGVVAHAVGNTLEARLCFYKAVRAKADFADAHASRGTLNVYQRSVTNRDRSGPRHSFALAAQYSRDKQPIVPLIGRGCTLYGTEDYEEALACFRSVPQDCDLTALATRNAVATELARLNRSLHQAQELGTFVQHMELNLDDGQQVVIEAPDSGILMSSSGWGITGIDIHIPPIITIHLGPKPTPGGTGTGGNDGGKGGNNGGGENGGEEGDKGGQPGQGNGGGEEQPAGNTEGATSAPADAPVELLPSGGIGLPGGIILPDPDTEREEMRPTVVLNEYANLANVLDQVTTAVSRQTAGVSVATSSQTTFETGSTSSPLGGVDADVSGVQSTRDDWAVCSVYGLLYAVPLTEG